MIDPLIRYEPAGRLDFTLADEAVALARELGLELDPEQELVLRALLARRVVRGRPDKWAAFEVGMVQPRQNGKGGVIEARELAGIVLVDTDRLLIHSAHEYGTSLEAMHRMVELLEGSDIEIRRMRTAHGEQGFDFQNGTRIRYRTRTGGGGRGFSCDFLSLDEAMDLPERNIAALLPMVSARVNPQVLYTGSAVDQDTQTNGKVLARVRERGMAGKAERFAYFEWALEFEHPELIPEDVISDPDSWEKVNPAMMRGRITREHVSSEFEALARRTFAVERLGVGDWPATMDDAGSVIKIADWNELQDPTSEIYEPICLGWDVSPDRQGAIAAGGRNQDGHLHGEIVDARQGTAWIPERIVQLARAHGPLEIVCDERGPGANLIADVEEALLDHGYELRKVNASENAQACGLFVDAVREKELRHLGDLRLENALRGAATRPLADSFSWARRSSSVNIAPLVALTLAVWASAGCPDETQELAIY